MSRYDHKIETKERWKGHKGKAIHQQTRCKMLETNEKTLIICNSLREVTTGRQKLLEDYQQLFSKMKDKTKGQKIPTGRRKGKIKEKERNIAEGNKRLRKIGLDKRKRRPIEKECR